MLLSLSVMALYVSFMTAFVPCYIDGYGEVCCNLSLLSSLCGCDGIGAFVTVEVVIGVCQFDGS